MFRLTGERVWWNKEVWENSVMFRYVVIVIIVLLKKLFTVDNLYRRGIKVDSKCIFCNFVYEF